MFPRLSLAGPAFLAGLLAGPSAVADAQTTTDTTGSVRGSISSRGGPALGGAQLRIRVGTFTSAVTAESDDDGSFGFGRVPVGEAWLLARRIGYRPDSIRVRISKDSTTTASFSLERLAVELSTVNIVGRRDVTGPMAGFYKRMANGGGRFFTFADLDRRNAVHMTDVFRMVPGMRIETRGFQNSVRIRGSRCAPLVWLDNQPLYAGEVDLDAFDPRSFEGIEIYSGAASVPVEFQGNQRMSSACGTIVLWSRRGELRPKKRKKDEPTPAMRIAALIDEGKAFVQSEVDAGARPDSAALIRPVYPDSLFEAQTGGQVLAEFVVGTNGEAVMETFSAVTTTHREFVEPVRRAVREQRFTPAVKAGRVVQQVVQLSFRFIPDSTARRRR
jgi:hypothetical protein